MFIRSLNTMDKIVKKNSNLVWDGWDIVDLKENTDYNYYDSTSQ